MSFRADVETLQSRNILRGHYEIRADQHKQFFRRTFRFRGVELLGLEEAKSTRLAGYFPEHLLEKFPETRLADFRSHQESRLFAVPGGGDHDFIAQILVKL